MEEKTLMKYAFLRPTPKSLGLTAKNIRFYTSIAVFPNPKPKDFQNVEFFVSPKNVLGAFEVLKKLGFPVQE